VDCRDISRYVWNFSAVCQDICRYSEYLGSVSGLKRQGRSVDHPPRSSAQLELYLYIVSVPSWRILERTLTLISRFLYICYTTSLRNRTEILRTPGWDTILDADRVSDIQWLLVVFCVWMNLILHLQFRSIPMLVHTCRPPYPRITAARNYLENQINGS